MPPFRILSYPSSLNFTLIPLRFPKAPGIISCSSGFLIFPRRILSCRNVTLFLARNHGSLPACCDSSSTASKLLPLLERWQLKPENPFFLIFRLYQQQFLDQSVHRGLVNPRHLALAGDGTPVHRKNMEEPYTSLPMTIQGYLTYRQGTLKHGKKNMIEELLWSAPTSGRKRAIN